MDEKKCMKFSMYTLCVGDRVRIVSSTLAEYERRSATVTGFGVHNIGEQSFTVPEFHTDDGVDMDGTQCWWMPIDEALKAESLVARMRKIEGGSKDENERRRCS